MLNLIVFSPVFFFPLFQATDHDDDRRGPEKNIKGYFLLPSSIRISQINSRISRDQQYYILLLSSDDIQLSFILFAQIQLRFSPLVCSTLCHNWFSLLFSVNVCFLFPPFEFALRSFIDPYQMMIYKWRDKGEREREREESGAKTTVCLPLATSGQNTYCQQSSSFPHPHFILKSTRSPFAQRLLPLIIITITWDHILSSLRLLWFDPSPE